MNSLITTRLLINNTPLEDHLDAYGLLVKREDLCCPPPGPPFSKTRGVMRHVKARVDEGCQLFGVLDTFHSQAGHAVALACHHYSVQCVNFYPKYMADEGQLLRLPQRRAIDLGAAPLALQAGRSAILYHQARKQTEAWGGYMMPNALKLPETVEETAAEVARTLNRDRYLLQDDRVWLISASSGTIAAGVLRGLASCDYLPHMIVHMGYDRSEAALAEYINAKADLAMYGLIPMAGKLTIINEGYAYKDQARPGLTPPWPCNPWYDLKAFRWWMKVGRQQYGQAIFWNVG